MFFDFNDDHEWSSYDFVIVGAGITGLFLAERLSRQARVLVIEAGDEAAPLNQGAGYYELESIGRPINTLGARLSAFGGTSNHWEGQSRALSPAVFDNRDGVAGWPIAYEDFAVHLEEASQWLALRPFGPPSPGFDTGVMAGHSGLESAWFSYPRKLPYLGTLGTTARFAAMSNVDILRQARVSDLTLDAGGNRVASVEVIDRRSGLRHTLPVKSLLLCTGGVENPRLMRWAGRKYGAGNPLLGGPNELTGRYFMEHPVLWPLQVFLDHRADVAAGGLRTDALGTRRAMWSLTDEFLLRHRLLRFGVSTFHDGARAVPEDRLDAADDWYLNRSSDYQVFEPSFQLEQSPCFDSTVDLSERLDMYGDPIARLNWQIATDDIENYRRGAVLFGGLLSQAGLARTRLRDGLRDEEWSDVAFGYCCHHLGTTRMAHSRFAGVVDTNCRVFGLANLHVAGCSVFPNGDFVNPTYSMVALAARLATHMTADVRPTTRVLRFGLGQAENACLDSGWSHLEAGGVWTVGSRAELAFDGGEAQQLRLHGRQYGEVAITLSIDDEVAFSGPGHFAVGQAFPLRLRGSHRIVMTFENLRSPRDRGQGGDERLLGILLTSMELR